MSIIRETNYKRVQDVLIGGVPYYPRTIVEAVWDPARKKNLAEILDEIYDGEAGGIQVLWGHVQAKPLWITDTKPVYTAQEVGALPYDTPLFSGSYNDLTGRPTLGLLSAKDNILISDINATGSPGPSTFLAGDGQWKSAGGGSGGSTVSWGTVANNYIPLTVEGNAQMVALFGHSHTKEEVGLGNVDNTSDINKPLSQAAINALGGKAEVVHSHTKEEVGLGNVDNTSDLNKPISSATQSALNSKANTIHQHQVNDITDFPEGNDLVAGDNIIITESNGSVVISSTGGGDPVDRVNLVEGDNIAITESGNSLIISSTGGVVGDTMEVQAGSHVALNVVNNRLQFSAEAATVVAGDNISIEQLQNGDIEISSTGGGDPVNTMEVVPGDNISLEVVNGELQISSAGGDGPSGPVGWDDIQNKPTSFTPSAHTHPVTDISDLGDLALKDEIEESDINPASIVDLSSISGYNGTVVQYLSHDASGQLEWVNSI